MFVYVIIGLFGCLGIGALLGYAYGYNRGADEIEESVLREIEVLIKRIDQIDHLAKSGKYWLNYSVDHTIRN